MGIVRVIVVLFRAFLFPRAALGAEILALRHQLGVFQRTVRRPRLRQRDRILWVWLSRFWTDWRSSLLIVKPETVVCWHREGFRLYWRWKSRKKAGRPKIDAEIRRLIRRMSRENATWGAPRIQPELALLGYTAPVDGGELHVPASQTTLPDLANIPRESRPGHRGDRLLRRPNRAIPTALLLRRPAA